MNLLPLILLLPFCVAEWRRSLTKWSNDGDSNFTNFIFYAGNPHVTYKAIKCEKYTVLNESAPVLFKGNNYYWNDTLLRRDARHVCEYRVGKHEGKLSSTFKNERAVEALYFECGLFDICKGLQCVHPDYRQLGAVCVIAVLSISSMVGVLFVHRKCQGRKRTPAEKEVRMECKAHESDTERTFDTVV